MNNNMIWARVGSDIRKIVEELADERGISLSEYLRELVLKDLENRSYFKKISGTKENPTNEMFPRKVGE